ncbi:MAG TPA: VOC family protein [Candidatus Bathyarchaeia archaeon]
MKTTNLFAKVDTVIVRVSDLEKARRGYQDKLSLQPGFTDEKERIVVFNTGGETSFTIWELKPGAKKATAKTPSSFPIFYAPDIIKAHKELKERGVKLGSIQGKPGETQWFEFWDLDQNLLEACHY